MSLPEGIAIAPSVLTRARAEQVATLYGQWHRTTLSMGFGALLLCTVLWQQATAGAMLAWVAAIVANQGWRAVLVRAYRRIKPSRDDAVRWGTYWSIGSATAGALWGAAAVLLFPSSAPHQALLIVCLFGVVLGGLNLTAVYKPSFYGFVLPALLPLIARVAAEGDEVHLFTALVMMVVLAFMLTYGHRLNDLLTHSLAMRYDNVDLIGELTAQSKAAEEARTAAENANRAKSQFLAAASHDLRQPLHALGLFAAALASSAREPTIQPLVNSIHASVEALETLFGQLLDLSRLEAGALHPEVAPVALQPLFARLAGDFGPQARASGIALRVRRSEAVVLTDPLLLERILRNLIANALRYTRQGAVVVGTRRRGDAIRIDVIDTGIGIAAVDQQRIFDDFVQVEGAAGLRRGHGLGLGLAIVRRLATLLDHRVTLASTPGRGSRFSVAAPRASAYRVRSSGTMEMLASSLAAVPSAQPFAAQRVIVIDDDVAVTAAMHALFTAWGASVTVADTAEEALRRLPSTWGPNRPHAHLLVADLRLAEGTSGIDAIAVLRRALGAVMPALIISGDTTEAARSEALGAGIELLHKPVMAPALLAAAQRALRPGVAAEPDLQRVQQDREGAVSTIT